MKKFSKIDPHEGKVFCISIMSYAAPILSFGAANPIWATPQPSWAKAHSIWAVGYPIWATAHTTVFELRGEFYLCFGSPYLWLRLTLFELLRVSLCYGLPYLSYGASCLSWGASYLSYGTPYQSYAHLIRALAYLFWATAHPVYGEHWLSYVAIAYYGYTFLAEKKYE